MELAALERLKHRRHHFFSIAIDLILFKLASNEDMHNILDEFEGMLREPVWLCKMENLTVPFCYLWLTENFGSRHSPPDPPLKH